MHLFITILIFFILSFTALSEQGTWSTDDTDASQAEASLSGTADEEELEAQEEEVQLIEKEEYDPMEDPIVIEPQEQEDKNRTDE